MADLECQVDHNIPNEVLHYEAMIEIYINMPGIDGTMGVSIKSTISSVLDILIILPYVWLETLTKLMELRH